MVKITLYSTGEITTVLEDTKAVALKKLKELLITEGYSVEYNMDSNIHICNDEHGVQQLNYLVQDDTKDRVVHEVDKDGYQLHIPEPIHSEESFTFTAVIQQRSTEKGKYSQTRVLFREVRLGKLLFREHMWVEESKQLKKIPNGSVIEFRAKIGEYIDSGDVVNVKKRLIRLRYIKIIDRFNDKIELNLDQYKGK